MWISRRKWENLCERVDDCERTIRKNRENAERQLYEAVKKILKQPEELLKEIESLDKIRFFVDDFINSQGGGVTTDEIT